MADALDSGSSGSLSCEGSSPFLRRIQKMEEFLIFKDSFIFAIQNVSTKSDYGDYDFSLSDYALYTAKSFTLLNALIPFIQSAFSNCASTCLLECLS